MNQTKLRKGGQHDKTYCVENFMNPLICRIQRDPFIYYTCRRLPLRHAFTTKFGGVSTGHCESLNLGFHRGDTEENVRENYHRLAEELGMDENRITLTAQVHRTDVTVVTEQEAGTGISKPLSWETDALITSLPNTPLCAFSADCVVVLLYDPVTHTAGAAHAGWRGMAAGILPKTVAEMEKHFGTHRDSLIAVIGPSIRQECFETDADVPEAMESQLGTWVQPYIKETGRKFHVDLQGIGAALLSQSGLTQENIIDSGICTMCNADEFWSHRKTNGIRGVQVGIICL